MWLFISIPTSSTGGIAHGRSPRLSTCDTTNHVPVLMAIQIPQGPRRTRVALHVIEHNSSAHMTRTITWLCSMFRLTGMVIFGLYIHKSYSEMLLYHGYSLLGIST